MFAQAIRTICYILFQFKLIGPRTDFKNILYDLSEQIKVSA